MMFGRSEFLKSIIVMTILHRSFNSVYAVCELSVLDHGKLYNYSLAASLPKYRHGVLSEDGFYTVAVNETILWFQLCDGMLFNHDPPRCFDCQDCGGPSRCGSKCSALVANKIGGYPVCTTVGRASGMDITLIDKKNPDIGVVVKMSSIGLRLNCSLSVSVFCDRNGVHGPYPFERPGACDYTTALRHPSACAKIISVSGRGLGWFGILIIIIICLLGGYLLAGTVYRFFALGVRGVEVIPNLEFWISLPQRTQSLLVSLARRFRRTSQGYRSSYSPVSS